MAKIYIFIAIYILFVCQPSFLLAKKGVMPWMCLERCNETSADIKNNLQQIKDNVNSLSAVSFELFNLGPHSQLIVNEFTRVDNIIAEWGLETYAMVSSFPYPPEFLDWLRQLFSDPEPFIREAKHQAKKYGFTGYNLDFEPTKDGTQDDCLHYVKFLNTFSNAMHEDNVKVTVDIAHWNPLWCDWTLFGNSSVDRVMVMSTYAKNFDAWTRLFNRAVTQVPLPTLGLGLECDVGVTEADMTNRFNMIIQAGVQEIDIWKVTSEISVFSSVNLLAAITLQAYDPVSGTGVLEYTTSLQYPFKLSDVTNLIVPSPLIANYSLTDIDCPDTQNAPCTQKIRLVLIPNGACELTGQYNLTTAIACRGDQALCPLDANTNTALIASRVISEDFCEIIRFDIDLSGNLVVFQDAQYTTPKTAFLPSQTAYFLATVWSSKATIVSASISSVFYTLPDATSRSLYDAAANTALANANQFAITPKNATAEGFQFVISVGSGATDMFPVLVDANAQFQFSAIVEVEWQGLDGLLNNKRFVFGSTQSSGAQPSGVQDKKFDSSINVTALNNVGQTPSASQPLGNPAFSSASSVVVSVASAAVAFLALF